MLLAFQSDLLEHQRAQQQLQQQQLQQQQPPQQPIQQPPPPQQQTSLPPNPLQQQQQCTLAQSQAPTNQPNLASMVGVHQQKHQLQQLQGLTSAPAAASPSSMPAVVSSQTPSLATATVGGVSTLVGPGRSVPQGASLPPTAPVAVRSTVSGQSVSVHGGESQQAKTAGVGTVQPRPILPAPAQGTQGINMAGLNMLAAVGVRQQQQLQQQQQQATASPQPAQAKVHA